VLSDPSLTASDRGEPCVLRLGGKGLSFEDVFGNRSTPSARAVADAGYRPDIPPHVAEVIRHLPPDVKRGIKAGGSGSQR